MFTPGSQTSKFTPNPNTKPITTLKDLQKDFEVSEEL